MNIAEVPGAFPVACVHDEIMAEAPLTEAGQGAEWLARHLTAARQESIGDRAPIEVETTIGKDWAGAPRDSRAAERLSFPSGSE